MITLDQFQSLLGNSFFGGDSIIAGIVIYVAVLMVILVLTKKPSIGLIVALPVTYIFSLLGVLSQEFMILLIVITVLALAYTTRDIWRD